MGSDWQSTHGLIIKEIFSSFLNVLRLDFVEELLNSFNRAYKNIIVLMILINFFIKK